MATPTTDLTGHPATTLLDVRYDTMLSVVNYATQSLLSGNKSWEALTPEILRQFGQSLAAERMYLIENQHTLPTSTITKLRYDWSSDASDSPGLLRQGFPQSYEAVGFVHWLSALMEHKVVSGQPVYAEDNTASFNSSSVLVAPIFTGAQWWGCLVAEVRVVEHTWSASEQDSIGSLATIFGAAIERTRLEQLLHISEERNMLVARATNDVIWDSNLLTHELVWSGAVETMFGYSINEVKGNEWWDERVHPDDRDRVIGGINSILNSGNDVWSDEYRFRCGDQSYVTVMDRGYVARNEHGVPVRVIGTMMDISARKAFEEQLHHQASHDSLTQLPNRALFLDRLTHALARAVRHRTHVAVLFLDLDRFKLINDSLGHAAGDQLLIAVAERITSCLRAEDTAARLGGDEFTVLLEQISDQQEAIRVADRISSALQAPLILAGQEVFVTTSIGIALSELGQDTPTSLLRDADIAMYHAKANGKARYDLFKPSMNAHTLQRLQLDADLRHALQRGELQVYYQPKIQLNTGKLMGMEALVRWMHPQRGLIVPAEFIPLAEETGLILPLEQWVLSEACRQGQQWRDQYPDMAAFAISVNVSVSRFRHRNLAADIANTLAKTGFPAHLLILEITESVVMEDAQANVATLRKLKSLGVQLAIDDFGTGYSSLSYLKRFPVDLLKIDRSFVARLGENNEDTAIVQAVVTLAHTLELQVIAEGIETPDQLDQLLALGCDFGQGYWIARPAPPADAVSFLQQILLIEQHRM